MVVLSPATWIPGVTQARKSAVRQRAPPAGAEPVAALPPVFTDAGLYAGPQGAQGKGKGHSFLCGYPFRAPGVEQEYRVEAVWSGEWYFQRCPRRPNPWNLRPLPYMAKREFAETTNQPRIKDSEVGDHPDDVCDPAINPGSS